MNRILLLVLSVLVFSSCNYFVEKPEAGLALAEFYQNKQYEQFDTAQFNQHWEEKWKELSPNFLNPKVIGAFYAGESNKATLATRLFQEKAWDKALIYLEQSYTHGFKPETFDYERISHLKQKLDQWSKAKKIDSTYVVLAELELRLASNFLKYHTFLKFGSIQPRRVLNRYFIPNLRPDSQYLDSLLRERDLAQVLRLAENQSEDYQSLKQELSKYTNEDPTAGSIKQILLINLERARWKMPKNSEEEVRVNIPDFNLTWLKASDTLAHMKVCVGARRQADYETQIQVYAKTKKLDDKPKNYETPQLFSEFNAIQVNPIWNIPVSIAQTEIYYQALKDPYYLSNNNMKVYYKGKLVDDPDTIQWSKYRRDKLPFQFKQGSGEGNALGKFKFIFENGSSIYLHDTNNRAAFSQKMRAISHGCVRVEDPLKFASLLVKSQSHYDDLRMEVSLPPLDSTKTNKYQKILAKKSDTLKRYQLKPTWFATRKNILIITDYRTAWMQNGQLQIRADVYDYDPILWNALKKYVKL